MMSAAVILPELSGVMIMVNIMHCFENLDAIIQLSFFITSML